MANRSGELLNCLASPAVGTDDRDEFEVRSQCVRQNSSVGDDRMRSGKNSGCAEKDCASIHQGHTSFPISATARSSCCTDTPISAKVDKIFRLGHLLRIIEYLVLKGVIIVQSRPLPPIEFTMLVISVIMFLPPRHWNKARRLRGNAA